MYISECADHFFGRECSKDCHCYRNLVCNKTSGHCTEGCAPGYTGQDCQTGTWLVTLRNEVKSNSPSNEGLNIPLTAKE